MAPNTPPDDDRDAEVDPWADIVADGLADDGDQGAFDFATLDVGPAEPAGEPLAARPPDDHPLDHVADDAVADLDGVFTASAAAAPGDSTALADDVFAALVGGDEPDDLAAVDGVAEEFADDDAFADIPGDRSAATPSLSVFAPDDAAVWGTSSTDSDAFAAGVLDDMAPVEAAGAAVTDGAGPREHEPDPEAFGWAAPDTAAEAGADGAAWGDVVSATTDDDASESGIPVFATDGAEMAVGAAVGAATGAAVAGGADAVRRAPRRPARGKSGVGQFVGIVLGGALSIPIVLGILIGTMWMGRPDPIGMRRWLPGASFLLPPARQPRGGGDEQPRNLDSLSPVAGSTPGDQGGQATDPSDVAPPAGDAGAPVAAVAAVAPAVPPVPDVPAAVPTPTGEVTEPAASPAPADRLAAVPAPAVADLDALAAVAALPPEPEPLDLATLDAAVEQAAAAAGILDGADADDPDRRRHMVAWYRSLARVAEELAAVEVLAIESGRPFEEAAVRIDPLMNALAPDGPLGGDLVRLARNWLTYARRDNDGVVLPVTFQSARPVGPYWCSKVVIEDVGGEPRELAVVSRQRPFLEIGERCVVTGVLFDGGTVWAADVRSTDAVPAVQDAPARPEQSATDLPTLPPATVDAPPLPEPPAADAVPRKVPAAVPDIDVPEIPLPDLGVPGPPVPPPQSATEPAAGADAPAADDF